MDLIILGFLGLVPLITIGALVFRHYSQSRSSEELIEIETNDHCEFSGRFHSAHLIADGKTVEFEHVRSIGNDAHGIYFLLAEGKLQYGSQQVEGKISINVPGVSDPVEIPINQVGHLWRRKIDRTASESIARRAKGTGLTEKSSTEVIEYLSKEITTTTANMMVFRTKIAFLVFVGPFILLIALAARFNGLNITSHFDRTAKLAIILVGIVYLILAGITAGIERQAWLQCNKWRGLIAQLHNDPSADVTLYDLSDNLFSEDWKGQSTFTYVAAWGALLLSFSVTIIIILRVFQPSTSSQTSLSDPAQKVSVSPER